MQFQCMSITIWLLAYPPSFTRVGTSKSSAARHYAFNMCSIARDFTHQASIHII